MHEEGDGIAREGLMEKHKLNKFQKFKKKPNETKLQRQKRTGEKEPKDVSTVKSLVT